MRDRNTSNMLESGSRQGGKNVKDTKKDMAVFISAYVKAFQDRYGENVRPDLRGKVQGQIKTLLKDVPLQRACALIQVYLQMETPWFKTKAYDMGTFLENLNPIGIALDTGEEASTDKLDFSGLNDG
jgi:hypothetical protein